MKKWTTTPKLQQVITNNLLYIKKVEIYLHVGDNVAIENIEEMLLFLEEE